MANLKVVYEEKMECWELLIYSRVLNLHTNKYVFDPDWNQEDPYWLNYATIKTVNEGFQFKTACREGLCIVNINGDSKAIVKWEKESDPYYEKGGKRIWYVEENAEPEEIIKGCDGAFIYNQNGKRLFHMDRKATDREFVGYDFKIKFGNDTIACFEIETLYSTNKYKLTKTIYDYEGKKLFYKEKTITNQDIMNNNMNNNNEFSM